MALGGKFAGLTECRKQFLDFKLLSVVIFPYKEWASFVSCLSFSTLAHTSRLMLGGVIPDYKYNYYISWFETSRDSSACTIEL